ncbi:hypothetical protein [Hippea maritima]|uniref:Porin n=1 Tax=Hippea maritima (strain ATCC 700847 / DSM 10411 / MH2) TaxID=760142 RepID=F2LTV8_HIPMA|nr:hypothetical protein [Hippea maritima]AEA34484.1 hypothetical protein Hipma_1528 [Hippea maritima DSM 10411]
MKKRLISLVAAAALVGGIATVSAPVSAQAGTVAVKGDTQVQMYGFIRYIAGWTNKMETNTSEFLNMPYKDYSGQDDPSSNDTKFMSSTYQTRLGLNFKNEDANLTGKIEAHFYDGSFGIRKAYIQHNFDNFYLRIGRDYGLELDGGSFSTAFEAPVGMNGASRNPQIKAGTSFDLGGAKLDAGLALEDVSYTNVSGVNNASISRKVMPGVAAKLALSFETGFGAPARIYAYGMITPLKIKYLDTTGKYTEKSKTPVIFGTGLKLPVSMVTLNVNYVYGKGATKFAGLNEDTNNNIITPYSYYYDGSSLNTNRFDAFNIEAKIKPMPCVAVAGGYDYAKFKHSYGLTTAGNKDQKPYVSTYFANVAIQTTKYTQLTLEWRHVEDKYFQTDTNGDDVKVKGNQYFMRYTYSF